MCVEDNWPVGGEFTNICPLNLGSTVSTVTIKELFVFVLLRTCVCEAEKEEATLTGARENKQGIKQQAYLPGGRLRWDFLMGTNQYGKPTVSSG